ncbi:hypothetical protein A3I42_03150 [Candidatus Uhrbacteria bacterium RIFCSPLOWO2_02_FULL_49_11]|uniref:Uncharacterized protein n=1 Tax=Candidatus Uhrbacteria bacterium RIFCSPLOWO2_02_FULL_49_11 TaxID=1802409 RepID=A0A1F7VCZ6_9BACT|nr:MAG: hypothetical protein A3I42_03150 [Candidatus Uhrbacteria bacterium RIFCSPLOWO2_02_FULL_49_11]
MKERLVFLLLAAVITAASLSFATDEDKKWSSFQAFLSVVITEDNTVVAWVEEDSCWYRMGGGKWVINIYNPTSITSGWGNSWVEEKIETQLEYEYGVEEVSVSVKKYALTEEEKRIFKILKIKESPISGTWGIRGKILDHCERW